MKTSEEMIDWLAVRMGNIFQRPLMYGGTGAGVEDWLYVYTEFWAEIVDRRDEWQTVRWQVGAEEDCGSNSFSGRYAEAHPEASEPEISAYTVAQWRKVADRLGMPVVLREAD
ncbi:hypothetical protein [Lignipirellula cremea]|uniref:Uncharacterized protein n=1 Tax=Lignipirellula cremea TaxID=2528010 RepID=A0A518DQ25_9BACT|nr:hypothetical protein [Lignipirellula cremea]QDU93931.1 hypothetical protein Pla8534_17170 [Lignipirellula cremea]